MPLGEYLTIAAAVTVGAIVLTEAVFHLLEWLDRRRKRRNERADDFAHGDVPAVPRTFSEATIIPRAVHGGETSRG